MGVILSVMVAARGIVIDNPQRCQQILADSMPERRRRSSTHAITNNGFRVVAFDTLLYFPLKRAHVMFLAQKSGGLFLLLYGAVDQSRMELDCS